MREQFSRFVGPVIDKVLGLRCTSFGYQYSEIAGSLASVYFCGGDCVEDVTSHLMPHLSLHPTLRTCSSDTILRAISELAGFSEEAKRQWRDEHWEEDLQKAYDAGKRMAEKMA